MIITTLLFNNIGLIKCVIVLFATGCSTLFPDFDPYVYTSVKQLRESDTGKSDKPVGFKPSLGIPKSINLKPWTAPRKDYMSRGLSSEGGHTVWIQLQGFMNQLSNPEVKEVTGNLGGKLDAAMGNFSDIPQYLRKSLVRSHDSYVRDLGYQADITYLKNELKKNDRQIVNLLEEQLEQVQNLRETIGEIKILEARTNEIRAKLPVAQLRIFINKLAKQASDLNEKISTLDGKATNQYTYQTKLLNELIQKENQLRLQRSDQLFYLNDVSESLISNLPALGSGWVQWSVFTLNENNSWNLRDDSIGWAVASLREDDLKQNAVVELSNDKSIAFSHEEIKSAMAWYYSLYGSGLEKHPQKL